jgi:tellurite resistance protein
MAKLGSDVFVALAAIGWADGELHPDEADAIVRTALEEGLELDAITEIEQATRTRFELETFDRAGMTKDDRLFLYAVAAWLARIDGKVTPEEVQALARLGDQLKVPERPRAIADAIALEIAALPDGDRPDRYDLPRLRATIAERLAEAQRLRAEAGES